MLTLDPCPFQYLERPLTPQRLAAARRALERERQRLPLFAADITQTAEERIGAIDESNHEHTRKRRNLYARQLRDLRRIWREIPRVLRPDLEQRWALSNFPRTASYALGWLRDRGWCSIFGRYDAETGTFTVAVTPEIPPGCAFCGESDDNLLMIGELSICNECHASKAYFKEQIAEIGRFLRAYQPPPMVAKVGRHKRKPQDLVVHPATYTT